MDRSKAEAIVRDHANPLKDFLGLTDWKVAWNVRSIAGDFTMVCDSSDYAYKQASVDVDDRGYDDEAQILDGMFHEFCHVIHASFSHYRKTSEALHPDVTNPVIRVEQVAWSYAAEGFVLRMEWLWRNHLRALYLDQVTRPEAAHR